MDQSYSESDVSLSPSKIFERLQLLRQLQIMQRGKLQKHHSQYRDSPEISSSVTEIVSHFSNSTSYNTFRSLLQSSQEILTDSNTCLEAAVSPRKQTEQDYIEGVSALNLSQESQFITNSPISPRSRVSTNSRNAPIIEKSDISVPTEPSKFQFVTKNQISLDEMPILSPKKDFEELILESLKSEKKIINQRSKSILPIHSKTKKPFLRRGEGMARFGVQKKDLIIQNTKALPWKTTNRSAKPIINDSLLQNPLHKLSKNNKPVKVQIIVTEPKTLPVADIEETKKDSTKFPPIVKEPKQEKPNLPHQNKQTHLNQDKHSQPDHNVQNCSPNTTEARNKESLFNIPSINNNPTLKKTQGLLKGAHPLKATKGHTWASVLTKEQDIFLRQLKQSDYYKNFHSPAKSTNSDTSCETPGSDTLLKLRQDREAAEQNMFELLENKVSHESFNLNNSFFNRFLRKNNLERSGESTPLVLQRCLNDNPDLLHLHPEEPNRNRNSSCCDAESYSDYTECSETCSSVSTCCSCIKGQQSTINQSFSQNSNKKEKAGNKRPEMLEGKQLKEKEKCLDDTVRNNDGVNADMADMNAKLIATSELLKDRLKELEDEIETFRKENASLIKMREELDVERHKFYEEKNTFEQKYNEEKILSEYYLAEEKEKLNKQKQIYDRYVREIRGRLNKKEKDEVMNLKREIAELKEEIRNKDAKSTSTTARLRNQIKIMEKERKTSQDEIEKLKKENRRIQHSNEITRRLTNLKYLEQINKKLATMSSKDVHSETDLDSNIKYKTFEIDRQSRSKKIQPVSNTRRRAKSVPNLNVTSRYAKYFSQKDSVSDKHKSNQERLVTNIDSDCEDVNIENVNFDDSVSIHENDSEVDNNLEKMYNERFQSISPSNTPKNQQTFPNISPSCAEECNDGDGFFIQKSNSFRSSRSVSKTSLSPYEVNSSESSRNTSKSPVSIKSHRSHCSSKNSMSLVKNSEEYNVNIMKDNVYGNNRPKSPISILSNRTSASQRTTTSVNKDLYSDKRMILSPEPPSSRTSFSKTNLNPTELRKPDGSRELRFPNGNVKHISTDGKYAKFTYYNGDVKENFYDEGRIKYFYAETQTYHTTHADGLEVLEFSDGQVEKRYKDGSSEIRLPNGSVRYYDPKNSHVREEWRFPDGAALTVSATGEQRVVFSNGQVEVHAKDHKRREFPDGTVKLVYNDGTSETRYASGRVRIKDKHGNLIMDSASG